MIQGAVLVTRSYPSCRFMGPGREFKREGHLVIRGLERKIVCW